jgi:hypothetical protein
MQSWNLFSERTKQLSLSRNWFLTKMSEGFKELEDAQQPLYEQQKVQYLLRAVKNDDVQVPTTLSIIRDRYLTDFDSACLTLSCTIHTCFTGIEVTRNKRSIGAVLNSNNNSGRSGRGRGRARHAGGRGQNHGRCTPRVSMNGVDVPDVTRNYTADEWDKLCQVGGQHYVYQRREFLNGRTGRGERGGCGGSNRDGGGGRSTGGHSYNRDNHPEEPPRAIAAVNTTEIVEYSGSASTIATSATPLISSDHGSCSGGRFGPRRE